MKIRINPGFGLVEGRAVLVDAIPPYELPTQDQILKYFFKPKVRVTNKARLIMARAAGVTRLVFRRTNGPKRGGYVIFPMTGKDWFERV